MVIKDENEIYNGMTLFKNLMKGKYYINTQEFATLVKY